MSSVALKTVLASVVPRAQAAPKARMRHQSTGHANAKKPLGRSSSPVRRPSASSMTRTRIVTRT
jgi:hypothetical protein